MKIKEKIRRARHVKKFQITTGSKESPGARWHPIWVEKESPTNPASRMGRNIAAQI